MNVEYSQCASLHACCTKLAAVCHRVENYLSLYLASRCLPSYCISPVYSRFSRLWTPCVEALAAALEFSTPQAWPVLLDQLITAQHSFLSGRHTPVADTGNAARGSGQMPGLQVELQNAMRSGDVEQTGGCTDAAVRLTNVLKVNTKIHPPVTACHAAVPSLASLSHLFCCCL